MSTKKRRKRRPRPRPRSDPAAEPRRREAVAGAAQASATGADERPPAPWGSFPLVELVVLVGDRDARRRARRRGGRGAVMIAVGLALGALAGLELSIREHFAGYRSHTLLLAGAAGLAVLVALASLVPLAVAAGWRSRSPSRPSHSPPGA